MKTSNTLPHLKNKPFGGAWSVRDPVLVETVDDSFRVKIEPQVFCERYKEWAFSTHGIRGLDRFVHLDYANGTTEVFDKFYQQHSKKRLRMMRGEYFYHQIQARNIFSEWQWLEDGPLRSGDVFVISVPFSDTGDIPSLLPKWLAECERLKIPVMLDMAYLNLSRNLQLDIDMECIEVIATSLSKVFPVESYRIGLRLRQRPDDDTLMAYNQNSYVNHIGVNTGMTLIEKFEADWLYQHYLPNQQELCQKLDVDPSPCVILGIDRNNRFPEYNRGGDSNRLCFSRLWDGRIPDEGIL